MKLKPDYLQEVKLKAQQLKQADGWRLTGGSKTTSFISERTTQSLALCVNPPREKASLWGARAQFGGTRGGALPTPGTGCPPLPSPRRQRALREAARFVPPQREARRRHRERLRSPEAGSAAQRGPAAGRPRSGTGASVLLPQHRRGLPRRGRRRGPTSAPAAAPGPVPVPGAGGEAAAAASFSKWRALGRPGGSGKAAANQRPRRRR